MMKKPIVKKLGALMLAGSLLLGTFTSAELVSPETVEAAKKKAPKYTQGDKGSHVTKLKKDLTKLGYGNFGKKPSKTYTKATEKRVKQFQKAYKLKQTGKANTKTLKKMRNVLSAPYVLGDRGVNVQKIKKDLYKLGYMKTKKPSMNYTVATTKAVKKFQGQVGLKKTGKANKSTIKKLNALTNSKYSHGKKGKHVVTLKKNLTQLGHGNFGKRPNQTYTLSTVKQVKNFQKRYKMPQTGVADTKTLNKIKEVKAAPYKQGYRGKEIQVLKKDLYKLGFMKTKKPSMNYTAATKKAVKKFQKEVGLKQTGNMNKSTINKIKELRKSKYSNGNKGKHVSKMKLDLRELGYIGGKGTPNASYGPTTRDIVKKFQKDNKLKQTGVADKATLSKMKLLVKEKNTVVTKVTESKTVPFKTVYQDDNTLAKGTEKVKTQGKNGKIELVYEVTKVSGKQVSKVKKSEKRVMEPVNKVILKGTKVEELKDKVEIKTEVKTTSIDYKTVYQDDNTLYVGETKVGTKGVKGTKETRYEVTYKNGKEESRVEKGSKVTKQPVNEVVLKGTKAKDVTEVKTVTDRVEISFNTRTEKDSNLVVGETKVIEGKKGIKEVTYEVTYVNGKEKSKVEKGSKVVQAPVDKVIKEGTKVVIDVDAYEQEVVRLVNELRAERGYQPLKVDPVVAKYARDWSTHLTNTILDIKDFNKETGHSTFNDFLIEQGKGFIAGENVAAGRLTSQGVVDAWMSSPPHMANMMNPNMTHVGVGYSPGDNTWDGKLGYWTLIAFRVVGE